MRRNCRLGVKIFDEFSQFNAKLWHAELQSRGCGHLNRATEPHAVARATEPGVDDSRYGECDQTWGAMPVVIVAGDELSSLKMACSANSS